MPRGELRRGMTLIEVVAAIAISGLVIAAAAALLDQVNDQGARIADASLVASRNGNGRRLLRDLLVDAEPSLDTADRFRGDSTAMAFRTRCPTSLGWKESCHVRLAVDQRDDSSRIIALFDGGAQIPLRAQRGVVMFKYLSFTSSDSIWTSGWTTSATLPGAIAIVGETDTLVLPVAASRE
jgi:prepilin-type N-terminal cleavage/methylation domain-containing protein